MPFLDEIAAKLVADAVGVVGSSIFLGSKAVIPTGAGPYLSLVETGGTGPKRVQDSRRSTRRPTAQVLSRATNYQVARAMIEAAYLSLDGLFNVSLSGTFYQSVTARQEPTDIGLDDAGRARIAFNIDAQKSPS